LALLKKFNSNREAPTNSGCIPPEVAAFKVKRNSAVAFTRYDNSGVLGKVVSNTSIESNLTSSGGFLEQVHQFFCS
jgi:hypothetical protein